MNDSFSVCSRVAFHMNNLQHGRVSLSSAITRTFIEKLDHPCTVTHTLDNVADREKYFNGGYIMSLNW